MAADAVTKMSAQLDKAVNCMDETKILDIIAALEVFPITIDLLKITLIGKKLVQLKKKLNSKKKHIECIDRIILKWKNLVPKQGGSTKPVTAEPRYDIFHGLSEARVKIIEAFSKELEKSIDIKKGQYTLRASSLSRSNSSSLSRAGSESKATMQNVASTHSTSTYLAYSLESSINKKFPEQTDSNNYKVKVRSILSNLKNNEGLRKTILNGTLRADTIIDLSIEQLASNERAEERKADISEISSSHRSDFMEITRAERMQQNGIDLDVAGDFVCEKCNSKSTSYFEFQILAGDEPTTIFITCNSCGNRWAQ